MASISPKHLQEIIHKFLNLPVQQQIVKVNIVEPRVSKIRLTVPGKFHPADDSLASMFFGIALAKSTKIIDLLIFTTEDGQCYGVAVDLEDQQIWISEWE